MADSKTARHLTILTGASRGMGLAMAEQLLGPGALVLGISRNSNAQLEAQARQVGATLLQWNADLSDAANTVERLQQWLQSLDASPLQSATLINNAGVLADLVPLRDAQSSDMARALRVGLEAPMLLSAAFLRATRTWMHVPRKVLNISSGLGQRAMASSGPYCAAKAGMDHFTRCLALEESLVPNGAKVCSLAPGVIDTDMQLQLRSADGQAFPDLPNFAGMHAKGQLTSPAEAAKRVLNFLSRKDFGSEPVADVRGH